MWKINFLVNIFRINNKYGIIGESATETDNPWSEPLTMIFEQIIK